MGTWVVRAGLAVAGLWTNSAYLPVAMVALSGMLKRLPLWMVCVAGAKYTFEKVPTRTRGSGNLYQSEGWFETSTHY